ncbi:hypothetical protein OSB04_008908 [Centaurea solstitialis]|uniref:Uncharacterized protein n=1 Tax=Centaurea solstitialis TaxID=347529 RepID=A0AA38TV71_9ASTR|nr:hypothetical protein OSB04_008908 [Centaurea solstitialis]
MEFEKHKLKLFKMEYVSMNKPFKNTPKILIVIVRGRKACNISHHPHLFADLLPPFLSMHHYLGLQYLISGNKPLMYHLQPFTYPPVTFQDMRISIVWRKCIDLYEKIMLEDVRKLC